MANLPSRIGNFEVVRQIGSGGMGTVYLGRDPELNRPVAIKVLRDQVQDQELLERFFREARAAAALRHPNIITIYASGQHDFQPFIAMEFVEGESLADVIRHRRPLTLSDKLSYIEQICAGLHFAHRAGIIHRDVKPANLMADREGVIRILDFGIARVEGSGMTRDGALIGTLNYMSPEQMLGRPVDHRSDIFAVGAVAYELLCYQQAFRGGVNDGLLQRLPNEDPPPLRELYKGLPPGLERVVMRALQKAPDKRFPDLADMRMALVEVRRQLDIEASLQTIVMQPGPAQRPPSSRAPGSPPTGASTKDAPGLLSQPRETKDLSVRQYLADASVHLEKGDSLAAMRVLKDAVALDPANLTARQMLARVQQTAAASAADNLAASSPAAAAGTIPTAAERAPSRTRLLALTAIGAVAIAAVAAVPWLTSRDEIPAAVPTDPVVTTANIDSSATSTTAAPPAPLPGGTPSTTAAPAPVPPATVTPRGAAANAAPATPGASTVDPRTGVTPPAAGRLTASPVPTPAPADTASADAAIQDLLARVRTMYTGGDLDGALDLLAANPAVSGDPRISELAGRVANAAFDAMSSAEKSATSRNAAEFASDTLRLANDAKGRAEAARQRAAIVNSGVQALMARDAFQQAATDALLRRNQPAAAPTSAAAPAPALAAPPPAAAPNPLDRERPGIIAALGRFQAAYRDRDMKAVLQVFPSLRREAQQALQRNFDNCRAYEVDFGDERFLMDPADPATAQVNVRSTYICTPRTGQRPVSAAQRDVFTLRKRGDTWLIDSTGRVD